MTLKFHNSNIPAGTYDARITNITVKETRYGPSIQWDFEIINHSSFSGRKVTGLTGNIITPKSSLKRWLDALAYDVQPGDALETDELIGKTVKIIVKVSECGFFANVKELKHLPQKAPFVKISSTGSVIITASKTDELGPYDDPNYTPSIEEIQGKLSPYDHPDFPDNLPPEDLKELFGK